MSFTFKAFVALLPLIASAAIVVYISLQSVTAEAELKKVLKLTNKSMVDAKVSETMKKEKKDSYIKNFIEQQNAKLNLVGLNYKYETCIAVAAVAFIIAAILSKLVFHAGPMLMVYLGLVFAGVVLLSVNKKAENKKEELTLEFLEKINEISAHLSVGKTISNAIDEIIRENNTSPVLLNELANVKQNVNLGYPLSEAFMQVYEHLQIDEIKTFAMTLSVYEETGGNIIEVLKANDNFFQSKIKIKNSQKVYISSLKTSQKLTVGIPLGFIVVVIFVNPSFFGDFYGTATGELIGIIAITCLLFGIFLSNRIAEIK